ncbi:glycosyltransferase family 49 protein [Mucor lusitanicus]|uniref:Glycosyltransferase family 49 protein n=2 Tax=Mucor circinelloides f. lusitanicus TaxID=29924 RepID=A0A162QUP2_MUCCL|nr:glycosyltransferase family 49 protein [Mucor lusitanicus]OAD05820.1 glycosyltransferase family 49 protein [Mucor lusitanicus CBS 277.49]
MDSLLGGRSFGRADDDDDKKKRYFSNARRHYKPTRSSSTPHNLWQKRLLSPTKGIFTLIAIFFFVFLLYPGSSDRKNNRIALKNQPLYRKHESTCTATLCNPSNRCSTWKPNQKYAWSDLSKAGVFRDLSTIQLSEGCRLRVKVEGRVDDGEWLTIPEGQTQCTESGYGVKCRNFVEMDLGADILIIAQQMKKLMNERYSQSEEIVLVQHAMNAEQSPNVDVSMISQFSVNRLDTFKKAIEAWTGPISVAIYLTQSTDIDDLISYFENKDNLQTYSRVTITLVKPNYLDNSHLAYPINHLRNIAITESSTDYIFVIDADFTPSSNVYSFLRSRLLPFIIYQAGKMPETAWVVPCFAIREDFSDLPMPQTYNELRQLVGRNIAYITDPGAGHGPTLATEVAMDRPLLHGNPLAYEVCFESQWEPYYVVHRSAPLYDARFKNQGGDKQSHALHLNAERYRFMVLREIFMVHKDHSALVWPGGGFEKSQKAATNWNYFEDFMREIESLYGASARWPRGCSAEAIGWQDQRRDVLGLAAGAV